MAKKSHPATGLLRAADQAPAAFGALALLLGACERAFAMVTRADAGVSHDLAVLTVRRVAGAGSAERGGREPGWRVVGSRPRRCT